MALQVLVVKAAVRVVARRARTPAAARVHRVDLVAVPRAAVRRPRLEFPVQAADLRLPACRRQAPICPAAVLRVRAVAALRAAVRATVLSKAPVAVHRVVNQPALVAARAEAAARARLAVQRVSREVRLDKQAEPPGKLEELTVQAERLRIAAAGPMRRAESMVLAAGAVDRAAKARCLRL